MNYYVSTLLPLINSCRLVVCLRAPSCSMSSITIKDLWRWQLFHRVLFVGLILLLANSQCFAFHRRNTPPPAATSNSNPVCTRQRRSITVNYPGCESTNYTVPICSGQCRSYTYVELVPPYQVRECNCCTATSHRIGHRKITFKCNGVMTEHKVYLGIIEECGCKRCR